MTNTQEPIYDARKLGVGKMLLLGIQHMFAMFGATILVPILVNNYFGGQLTAALTVSVTLFCAGAGTLLFHLCSKFKVPAFLGSSFAFLGGFATIASLDTGKYAGMAADEKVLYACGGIVIAGLLYLVLALIVKLIGVKRVMRFIPPVVTGPIIICIGLSLAGSAISNASTNWLLAIIALVTIIIFNIWGRGMFKIIPILMGVVVSYLFALLFQALGMTNPDGSQILNFAPVAASKWVGLPPFRIAKFDITAILVMAPIALATMMEHIGDISAISSTTGINYIKDPGLHRTLTGDGLATTVASLFGAPANTTYGENTGVLTLTKVYDPAVIRLAAWFAVALSFCPKFAAIIEIMPAEVIGGISLVLYGMISAVGVRNLVETHCDFSKSRNVLIAALILVLSLGISNSAMGAINIPAGSMTISFSGLATGSLVGIILNAVLPGKDYVFDEGEPNDTGVDLQIAQGENLGEEMEAKKARKN
ncbi:MAG TPA: ABC transporter permease [Lachnospiraceae bacterium]|nr:ABC transporter permease [Lachnospiraceae bacterium]